MFKKLGLLGLALGAFLLNPTTALAERHHEHRMASPRYERRERAEHFRRPYFIEPYYSYPYWWGHPMYGYYDQWGVWHPYRW